MGKASKSSKRVTASTSSHTASENESARNIPTKMNSSPATELAAEHLPPIAFVMIVLLCSGSLWIFAMRDVIATGKTIAGSYDDAFLVSDPMALSFHVMLRLAWNQLTNEMIHIKLDDADGRRSPNQLNFLTIRKGGNRPKVDSVPLNTSQQTQTTWVPLCS